MANPSPPAITAIVAKVATLPGGFASNTDAQIAANLNAPAVANPVAQQQVTRPFGAADVVGLISPGSVAKVLGLSAFETTIRPMLDLPNPRPTGDITRLTQWAGAMVKAGILTQAEYDALCAPAPGTTAGAPTGLFYQQVADPTWPAQISWAVANLGRPVDAADILVARTS